MAYNGVAVIMGGWIDNTPIGTTTPDIASVTTLDASGISLFTDTTNCTPGMPLDGAVQISGGVSIAQDLCVGGSIYGSIATPANVSLWIFRDEKTTGTNGGTFTSGSWTTRTLNTTLVTSGSEATLASNQITLYAGSYWMLCRTPAFRVDENQSRLYNVSDSSVVVYGTSAYNKHSDSGTVSDSIINYKFTIASTKTFQIEHKCGDTQTITGFGLATGLSSVEVYTEVTIMKLG